MRTSKYASALLLCVLTLAALAGCGSRQYDWTVEPLAVVGGFDAPMGAEVDEGGVVYVSNIEPGPDEGYWSADAAAFVSRVLAGGRLVDERWVSSNPTTFLHAPKGMAILDGWLYVADLNRLVRYPLDKADQGEEIAIPQARDLVDLATDGRVIYASDGAAARLYRLDPRTMEVTTVAAPTRIAGIFWHDGALYATSVQNRDIYRIDPEGKRVPVPQGLADYFTRPASLVVLEDGSFIVADYDAGQLLAVMPDRIRVQKLADVQYPGIIGLDAKRNLLYVPELQNNRVLVFRLSARPAAPYEEAPEEPPAPASGVPGEALEPPAEDFGQESSTTR